MALDGTMAGLVVSVADFLNRGDLAAAIPDFIALAEAQMNRTLRVRRMIVRDPAFAVGAEYVDLPADFAGPVSLKLVGDRTVLDCISPDAMAERKWERGETGGPPTAYCIGGAQFEFDAAPSAPVTAQLVYYGRLPPLATNGGNWLLSDHPDAYLYGALLQSAPYLQDDERLAVWAQIYASVINDIQRADARESFGARLTAHATQVA